MASAAASTSGSYITTTKFDLKPGQITNAEQFLRDLKKRKVKSKPARAVPKEAYTDSSNPSDSNALKGLRSSKSLEPYPRNTVDELGGCDPDFELDAQVISKTLEVIRTYAE
ncbi:hypothetical protein MMC21_003506 [Puttea exsequens]|nr:hypothetical protein [Puttea exsequens]